MLSMKTSLKFPIILLLTSIILSSCTKSPENGVSLQLAKERKELITGVSYSLHFFIPASKAEKVKGKVDIVFNAMERKDIVLDFRVDESNIKAVSIDGDEIRYRFGNGHIIIPKGRVKQGKNSVSIDFTAGEGSLNRKEDILYTLFVPDRASTAFPCFDQPDLKAIYQLTLDIPKLWTAVTNGALMQTTTKDSTKTLLFGETKSLSTYLFAFVAGKFDTICRTQNGRSITLYHRENDSLKVKRNLDAIFNSHFHSLSWLKDYTGIDYPFGKLDIILIPDFQYSGMEHPGAIYYRDLQLFLDENPSVNQKLRQANLIAHEVSHQWFGDLVTMRWFNDVWLKEVFAGFMADKIVNPQYPDINHQLNFLLSHYPQAYSVDRTEGANPIRQRLDNLLFAGSLYGDIIYNKAPIMMMQLEMLMGEEPFKKGLRRYLQMYSMSNADWEDLVSILDPLTAQNLAEWSKAWVDMPGMPQVVSNIIYSNEGNISSYSLIQSKAGKKSSKMGMKFSVTQNILDKKDKYSVEMTGDTVVVNQLQNKPLNSWILPNSDGKGYGTFCPDSLSLQMLLNGALTIKDNLTCASWFVMLNELFLNGRVDASKYYTYLFSNLMRETEPQTRQYLLNTLEVVWWKFFTEKQRQKNCTHLEGSLFWLLHSSNIGDDERKPLFKTFTRIVLSDVARRQIFRVWNNEMPLKGVKLDEQDYMTLAYELAVRGFGNTDSILNAQELRIKNADRLAKFRFVRNAVTPDIAKCDIFFKSLSNPANRRPEPWVIEALHYFHHPLKSSYSMKYIKPSLDLLPEIQRTGDIFFPKSWLETTFWGYSSKEVYQVVDLWLKDNQELQKPLRDKVLQSVDNLKRAAGM